LKIKDQENAAKTMRKGFHDEICISGGEPRHQLAFAFHRLLCTPADETLECGVNQRSPKRANHCRRFTVSAIIEDPIEQFYAFPKCG
jgi:hypothetical protein